MSPIRKTRISKLAAEIMLRSVSSTWREYRHSQLGPAAANALEEALIAWEASCSEVGAAEAARPRDGVNDPLLALADNGIPDDEQIETLFIGKRG